MRVTIRLKSRVLGVRCVPEPIQPFKTGAFSAGTRYRFVGNTIVQAKQWCSPIRPPLAVGPSLRDLRLKCSADGRTNFGARGKYE